MRVFVLLLIWASISPLSARAQSLTYAETRALFKPTEGRLLDRHGAVLQELRLDPTARRLGWVELSQISESLKVAVVRSEDQRFWSHHGVDWFALLKATVQNAIGSHPRGASTIPMQLAALLNVKEGKASLISRSGHLRRGYSEKVHQIREALALEEDADWTREHVLEAYLNLVSFRGELQGIGAASQALFGKDPHGLGLDESALLAALLRAPRAQPARVAERACKLAIELDPKSADCRRITALVGSGALALRTIEPAQALAPHLARKLLRGAKSKGETSVISTLDRELQEFVLGTLQRQLQGLSKQNVHDAAALVIDNESGDVLAYVAGTGAASSASEVDGIQARRQAGSTLKPFLYGLAIDSRYLTSTSIVEDVPTDIPVTGGVYRPRNYDKDFHGKDVNVRLALSSSLNVPAVKALTLVGVGRFARTLESFGFTGLREPEYYGPSLALGSADITLWDLTNAYRALARGGQWSEARLEPGRPPVRPSHRVIAVASAFIVSDILADRESRALTFGLENPISLRFWSAAKTGTSKDMRDNWCIGYSRRYTVGVWAGNFSGEPMWDVSGIVGAAPAWAEIMKHLHRGLASAPPSRPEGVLAQAGDYYLHGTEPVPGAPLKSEGPSRLGVRITYPSEGMIVARDPDIPDESQRIFFETSAGALEPGNRWLLNGTPLPDEIEHVGWQPRAPGAYRLVLADRAGKSLDALEFQVKGQGR